MRQISVFVENKKGRLYSLTKTLAGHGIDLKAFSVADTAKFGILRMIVNDPDKTLKIMKEANFTVNETEVIGVELENRPGGLADVLKVFADNDISVEYLYSFAATTFDNAVIIFRVEDVEKATKLLKDSGLEMKIMTEDMI